MKRHPWGKIPAIVFPDGFTLYESRPICRCVAKKYSIPLLPSESDVEAGALFDQAQSVETTYFEAPAGRVAFEKFVKKEMLGLSCDDAVVEDALRLVEAFFNVADGLLSEKRYMAGDVFSLVDIFYIPMVRRLFVCGHEDLITSRGNVSAWWERCMSRPAVQKMLAADKEAAAAAGR